MDAVEFLKEKVRMCESYKDSCAGCDLYNFFKESNMHCIEFLECCPEESVSLVEQWSQSHPQKTMMQDFFEKFPNAPKDEKEGGVPKSVCPKQLGYTNKNEDCTELFDCDCLKCWSRPLEE